MRSLATLGGVLVLIVLAIAWRISNSVEAGQEVDPNSGIVTLGIESKAEAGEEVGQADGGSNAPVSNDETGSDSSAANASDDVPAAETESANPPAEFPPSAQGGETPPTEPSAPEEIPSSSNDFEAVPAETSEANTSSYTVKDGDTLYRILMNAYGKASPELIDAVALANDMDDPSALTLGQVLILPIVEGFAAPNLDD